MTNTRCGGEMTEAQYLSWIRSALRSKSLRWKPRGEALKLARRKYKGINKLQKWEYQCAICKEWWLAKECDVDHFPKDAGSILKIEDVGEFCNNLFCEVDNLRVLDKKCHKIYTLSQKSGLSFEEATVEKEVIDIIKNNSIQDILDFIQDYEYSGNYSNAKDRREAVKFILNSIGEKDEQI